MTQTMTVHELLLDIDAATSKMSATNPTRNLLIRAGLAVIELATRLQPPAAPVEDGSEIVGHAV